LVIRTGEIYRHDLTFHAASANYNKADLIRGNSIINHGVDTHILLLRILRNEVCEKRQKMLLYRTWDFGHLHDNPAEYLAVTSAIEPHPNLVFAIKHQRGDFHRLLPFNPTLGIGRHPQIVEECAQMDSYGKGAHPYYIAQGILDGWEEYGTIMKPGQPRGLRDLCGSKKLCGRFGLAAGRRLGRAVHHK
jgi:hypothetical protein